LLSVLRERLGVVTVKDGCAPQGQCGCCTVLVDGDARVACVTPAARIAGRSVTTLAGLPDAVRDGLVDAFVATGGSQCGFCTPGIIVRLAALGAKGRTAPAEVERALAAHLCRCTGWQSIFETAADFWTEAPVGIGRSVLEARDWGAAGRRAALEGGAFQGVGVTTPLGDAGFADDTAPRDALVAIPCPPGVTVDTVTAAGMAWVVGDSLDAVRERAGKTQGRRTTVSDAAPFPLPPAPAGAVRLTTSWVEPGYLEPDASWCAPGGVPATPLANGGAFGGKVASAAPMAARALADAVDRTVRVVFAREDVVRLGPKRPPISAYATAGDGRIEIRGTTPLLPPPYESPYAVEVDARWEVATARGPAVSNALRAAGLAEHTVLVEGAIEAAGWDRTQLVDARAAAILLDTVARSADGAVAGAHVEIDEATGAISGVHVRVDAGDPLDPIVLRSYVTGAAHMALGWVLTESIAVDPETGEVLDLTIRSFGIIRPKSMPPVTVETMESDDEPRALASDAAFAAVAAATWNAVTRSEGRRPETFPAVDTRAARMLRR
jgi:aerobic-type carbon monoxide dehydrogenase small subunit (CoxS/CutS family)